MLGSKFYYGSLRNATIAFGSLFSNISIDRVDSSGEYIKSIKVPLIYSQKESFIKRLWNDPMSGDKINLDTTMPRMGFSIGTPVYDTTRKLHTLSKLSSSSNEKFMYNRVPFTIDFSLSIGVRKMDDGYRIIEQILPYFTPDLTITVNDLKEFNISTDIPFTLVNMEHAIIDDTIAEKRTIVWELDFSAKIYLYANINESNKIKKTIVDINNIESNIFYEGLLTQIDPIIAKQTEDHIISETINKLPRNAEIMEASQGTNTEIELT